MSERNMWIGETGRRRETAPPPVENEVIETELVEEVPVAPVKALPIMPGPWQASEASLDELVPRTWGWWK